MRERRAGSGDRVRPAQSVSTVCPAATRGAPEQAENHRPAPARPRTTGWCRSGRAAPGPRTRRHITEVAHDLLSGRIARHNLTDLASQHGADRGRHVSCLLQRCCGPRSTGCGRCSRLPRIATGCTGSGRRNRKAARRGPVGSVAGSPGAGRPAGRERLVHYDGPGAATPTSSTGASRSRFAPTGHVHLLPVTESPALPGVVRRVRLRRRWSTTARRVHRL